ncbi:MAG: hydrogenase maturation nickel metallochaperone HypA [Inquilinus sp.]|nr:hydrogenase maturation nickel metallochaperone HypA [Inquilinus sp.]
MHEMSLTRSMVGIIEGQAATHGFQRVSRVRLEIGELSCVDPEALTFCFDAATRDTVAEGATLAILTVPGQAWCRDCDMAVPIGQRGEPCPRCGDYRLQIRAGDEIRIKDLEVD